MRQLILGLFVILTPNLLYSTCIENVERLLEIVFGCVSSKVKVTVICFWRLIWVFPFIFCFPFAYFWNRISTPKNSKALSQTNKSLNLVMWNKGFTCAESSVGFFSFKVQKLKWMHIFTLFSLSKTNEVLFSYFLSLMLLETCLSDTFLICKNF